MASGFLIRLQNQTKSKYKLRISNESAFYFVLFLFNSKVSLHSRQSSTPLDLLPCMDFGNNGNFESAIFCSNGFSSQQCNAEERARSREGRVKGFFLLMTILRHYLTFDFIYVFETNNLHLETQPSSSSALLLVVSLGGGEESLGRRLSHQHQDNFLLL